MTHAATSWKNGLTSRSCQLKFNLEKFNLTFQTHIYLFIILVIIFDLHSPLMHILQIKLKDVLANEAHCDAGLLRSAKMMLRERKPEIVARRNTVHFNTFKFKLFHGMMEIFLALFKHNFLVVHLHYYQRLDVLGMPFKELASLRE